MGVSCLAPALLYSSLSPSFEYFKAPTGPVSSPCSRIPAVGVVSEMAPAPTGPVSTLCSRVPAMGVVSEMAPAPTGPVSTPYSRVPAMGVVSEMPLHLHRAAVH